MTIAKARRRYPYGKTIKYLGDKEFIIYGGNWNFYGIDRCVETVTKNSIGKIEGYVIEISSNNCIGVEVDFRSSMDFTDSLPIKLLFKDDLFVRSF